MGPSGLYAKLQVGLTYKINNVMYHNNKIMGEKTHNDPLDTEKAFSKIQHHGII